jgi:hypothetical protein
MYNLYISYIVKLVTLLLSCALCKSRHSLILNILNENIPLYLNAIFFPVFK